MKRTRVLLVEDEPRYARFLREILAEGDPHDVIWVETLAAATARIDEQAFDVILLDLGLPDADGTEAVLKICAAAPHVPVVVLSALGEVDVALESMRVGAQEYLVKGQAEHALLARALRYAIERKRLIDGVEAARTEAERANAVKDEFLAMLGHELRNPLAPIVTALTILREGASASTARQLGVVERQVQRLVRLVDDLLDVSRIARGKLELKLELVDLADAIWDGVETAQPLFEGRNHRLRVEIERGRLFVWGDRTRLSQVFSNLLTNAAKYTDPGGHIVVVAREEGERIRVAVRDDGMGIAPELLPRVFDIFQQGTRTIDRAQGGLGLGLAIVKNVVQLHGGEVGAASRGPGEGSEFVVTLPSRAPSSSVSPGASAPAPSAFVPKRILVVDDNVDSAEMIALALDLMGHLTRIAHDGTRALELVREHRPDVALLDIGLPVIDGYELCRRILSSGIEPRPTLIAITGYGQQGDRERARAAGFDYHLVKPVDMRALGALIEERPPS